MTAIAAFLKTGILIVSLALLIAILVAVIGTGLGAAPKLTTVNSAPKKIVNSQTLRNIMELGTSGVVKDSQSE